MRASRLVALLLLLQHRSATAAELAAELEVSVRTIYRDVSALQAAGVPLWTEPGPHGGIRLLEGWRTTLDGITADEAAALFLSGVPGAAAELGLGSVLAAAEVKVLATLPSEARRSAAQVRERFLLDAPAWFHRDEAVPALGTVAAAVWQDRRLDLRYRRGEVEVERRVDPLGLVLKAGTWYLVAARRSGAVTYRVGRIATAALCDEPARRPDGFDLAGWWSTSQREFDRSIRPVTVRVRLDPSARRRLAEAVGAVAAEDALATAPPVGADGWGELDLAVESIPVATTQLVALGAGVEVLEPAELRGALAAIGVALARHNAEPTGRPERTDWTTRGTYGKARPR